MNIYPIIPHDSLPGFVANEHIDWTNATDDFLTTGTLDAKAITGTSLTLDMTQDYLFTQRAASTSLAIQSRTAGTPFLLELYSKDGDGTDLVGLYIYGKGLPSSITNSEWLSLGYVGNIIPYNYFIHSGKSGSGTARNLLLYTATNTSQLLLKTDGNNTMGGDLTVAGAIKSGTLTITASSDILDVSGVNTVFINITGDIILGGLRGGVDGQVVNFAIIGNFTNHVRFEHAAGITDTQDFINHTTGNEDIDHGGCTYVCNGTNWYDISHARHV